MSRGRREMGHHDQRAKRPSTCARRPSLLRSVEAQRWLSDASHTLALSSLYSTARLPVTRRPPIEPVTRVKLEVDALWRECALAS